MLLGAGLQEGGGNGYLVPECDMIGGQVGMQFQIGSKCGWGWNLVVCV